MSSLSADVRGRVVIVTGAGGGLGRSHALLLARCGAKVVVNDLAVASSPDASGSESNGSAAPSAAERVVQEILQAGGEAIAHGASVTDEQAMRQMVEDVRARWGRVDAFIHNAGILRDRSFAKMELSDFRLVMDVHLMGAVHGCKALWDVFREQSFGRIVLTTSSSGLWGNFGQSNYGAAKMALIGLMQTLGLEGEKYNIRVNCLAPTAATRMTEGLLPDFVMNHIQPEAVSPVLPYLLSEDAPNRAIVCAGAGSVERAYITMTEGAWIGRGDEAIEQMGAQWSRISDREGERLPAQGMQQGHFEVQSALKHSAASD